MSKHHKHRSYGAQLSISSREGLTLEILARAEKAGSKAGYTLAKEELYRSIGSNQLFDEQQTDELLAAAERAGAAAALVAARKMIDKTLRTSFHLYRQPTATELHIDAEPTSARSTSLGHQETRRVKVDQHVLTITRVERLSKQLVRIIASAPHLDGYRSNGALDEYVKVHVADPALGLVPPYDLRDLRRRIPREHMPRSKSYTIRWVAPELDELAIDFVVHGEPGTVGHWAGTVQPGEPLVISPARSKTSVSLDADFYVLAADEAGLPAITKALESLPAHSNGVALLEVVSQNSTFEVKHPEGVEIRWLFRESVPAGQSDVLVNAIQVLRPAAGQVGVIAHAERSAIKAISRLTEYWHLNKRATHISSYWTLRTQNKRRS